MANADLDKQPDSVSSVLKVFGILQALGEEREIGITEFWCWRARAVVRRAYWCIVSPG